MVKPNAAIHFAVHLSLSEESPSHKNLSNGICFYVPQFPAFSGISPNFTRVALFQLVLEQNRFANVHEKTVFVRQNFKYIKPKWVSYLDRDD